MEGGRYDIVTEIDWRTQLYFDYLTQRTTARLRQGHHPQTPLKCRLHACLHEEDSITRIYAKQKRKKSENTSYMTY